MKHLTILLVFCAAASHVPAQVVVIDGAGEPLGIYLEAFTLGSEFEGPKIGQRYRYHLITENGYRFLLTGTTGQTAEIDFYWSPALTASTYVRFESSDCSGPAYMRAGYPGFISKEADYQNRIWYAPKAASLQTRVLNSRLTRSRFEDDGCRTEPDPIEIDSMVEVYLHDPIVTGLHQTTPVAPIQFDTSLSEQLRGCLFINGFECEQ